MKIATNPIKIISSTAVASLILFSQLLQAAPELPEYKASYGIEKFGIKAAVAKYQLSYTDTGYKFSQNTNLYGLVSLVNSSSVTAESHIDRIGGNLLLTKHRYIRTGSKKDRNESFDILWNTHKNMLGGKITGTVRGKKIALKTDSEVWDALSFQIPLMIEAKASIKEYPYKALLKGEIDTYDFILTETKKINFSGKDYQTLKLIRTDPRKDKDRQLHIWLIPELHNIPVIIETYRDGDLDARAKLERVQFNNEKPIVGNSSDDDDDY